MNKMGRIVAVALVCAGMLMVAPTQVAAERAAQPNREIALSVGVYGGWGQNGWYRDDRRWHRHHHHGWDRDQRWNRHWDDHHRGWRHGNGIYWRW